MERQEGARDSVWGLGVQLGGGIGWQPCSDRNHETAFVGGS